MKKETKKIGELKLHKDVISSLEQENIVGGAEITAIRCNVDVLTSKYVPQQCKQQSVDFYCDKFSVDCRTPNEDIHTHFEVCL